MNRHIKRAARVFAIVILSLFAIALAIAFLSLPGCTSLNQQKDLDTGCEFEFKGRAEKLKLSCAQSWDTEQNNESQGTISGPSIGQ